MTAAEQGRFSQDLTCPLSIISEQLIVPKALDSSCLLYEKRQHCDTGLLVWGLYLLRTIGLHEDASAAPKYTRTKYRCLMHFNKHHNLVIISLMVSEIHQLCSVLSPSSDWTWELEEAAGFITQVTDRRYQWPWVLSKETLRKPHGGCWNKMHHCCLKNSLNSEVNQLRGFLLPGFSVGNQNSGHRIFSLIFP